MTQTMRTDYCGRLGRDDIGRRVTVCGWVENLRTHGDSLIFIDVRDRTGIIQCVAAPDVDMRPGSAVAVSGQVSLRPEGADNERMITGSIELSSAQVTVSSCADPLPIAPGRSSGASESLRLKHRYLDMRSDRLRRNLEARASVNDSIRSSMRRHEFLEVETPVLVASTPEGARDFIVPSRLRPGSCYALPQSPQLFKQLIMVGGIDRYYQIARCFRDEDLRSDRQLEFTQFDMEMSFADGPSVRSVVTDTVCSAMRALHVPAPDEVPEITWHEAMDRFGTDKPDTRFGMEIASLEDVFHSTAFKVFQAPSVRAIKVRQGSSASRSQLDDLTRKCKEWGAQGLIWAKVCNATTASESAKIPEGSDVGLTSPVAKYLTDEEIRQVVHRLRAAPGDMCYIVSGDWRTSSEVLGKLRLDIGRPQAGEVPHELLWVTDFPLFESIADDGTPVPAHHPFTMPHEDDIPIVRTEASDEQLLKVRSQSYDLVMDGWELGSGSVRIHDAALQAAVFGVLGISREESERRFGFLLEAFRYGPPPHAGFAFGIDRLTALLCKEDSIREVIAFPKTQSGIDPMTGSPSPATRDQLKELSLRGPA